MKGTVKKIGRTASGSIATIDQTEPPPPKTKEIINPPDWVLDQLGIALAGGLPVDWTEGEGGTILSVTVG